jgi:hypothetical protein
MVSIEALLEEINERTITKKVGIPNDEARISFTLKKNTVGNFDQFSRIIGDYYNHHFTQCVSRGNGLGAALLRRYKKHMKTAG